MKRKRYLSLRWKSFFLTGLVLSMVFTAMTMINHHAIEDQYHQQREQLLIEYLRETQLIIEQNAHLLESLGQTFLSFDGMLKSLKNESPRALKKAFDPHWWPFQLSNGLKHVVFYSLENAVLAEWGKGQAKMHLISDTNANGRTHHYLHCDKHCTLYISIPLHNQGEQLGSVLLGANLSQSLIDFRRRMDVDIGIVSARPPEAFRQYLPNWDLASLAITVPDRNIPLITRMSSSVTPNLALETQSLLYNEDNQSYEVALYQIPQLSQIHPTYWLFISNVTPLVDSKQTALRNNIILALLGLVIASGLGLLVSWQPLSRLTQITKELPDLVSQHRAFLQRHKSDANHYRLLYDESDIVHSSAIRLAKRLKVLNNSVRKRTQELEDNALKLEAEKAFTDALLDTAQALIITQDSQGNILLVNHYAQWVSGYSNEDLEGKPLHFLLSENDNLETVETILNQIQSGHSSHGRHHTDLKTRHGDLVHMAWYHSKLEILNSHHKIITVALDISDKKRIEENLGILANNDPLTGLFNRRRFTEEIEQVISSSHRYNHNSALLFFDLDNFKDVNDLSGHHAGDEILTKVADVLRETSRESDTLARLGGDEFAVILKETNPDDALISAKRFCRALNQIQIQVGPHTHQASSSIGIAMYPEHGTDLKSLLAHADIAMYKAKEEGRNRVFMYSEKENSPTQVKQRVFWNQKASELINDGNVLMYYQPIWDIKKRHISHYEALLRVEEKGKIYPPEELINAAERNNTIYDIDALVLNQVIQDLSKLEEKGISVHFNVNISGLSFQNESLSTYICDLITRYQVNPTHLTFEITETAAVADVAVTNSVMHQLQELGIKIALDDFGVGFSSIYYLKHFPIDFIKIDGSFIKNIHEDIDSQVLVKAIVQVAKAFNQKTVAEFVENEAILDTLKDLDIDYAQGYHIKHPAPLSQLLGRSVLDY